MTSVESVSALAVDVPLAVDVRGLVVQYGATRALDGLDLNVEAGERIAVMGPSGSGKSTLLHCIAGIVRPLHGEITVGGRRIDALSERVRASTRLLSIGLVFQFGDLIPELTLLENVALPLQLLGVRRREARMRARDQLAALDVAEVADRRAGAVSGGQAQRAAVARAVVHEPSLVLADEPTGSVDTVTSDAVMDSLVATARDHGSTLIVVTHDHRVAAHLDRLVTVQDGQVTRP